MLYKYSRVQLRCPGKDICKTGFVYEIRIILNVPNYIIQWDNEKRNDIKLYELSQLKDLTYDSSHNWHQNEIDKGALKSRGTNEMNDMIHESMRKKQLERAAMEHRGANLIHNNMREKQLQRNAMENLSRTNTLTNSALQAPVKTLIQRNKTSDVQKAQNLQICESTTVNHNIDWSPASEFAPQNSTDANKRKNLNYDAKQYEAQLKLHLTLFPCAICSTDTALKDCCLLSDHEKVIGASDLKTMFQEMISPLYDESATKYERNYAAAVERELLDGLLIHCKYACRSCIRQLQVFYKQAQKASKQDMASSLAAATTSHDQMAIASLMFETEPVEAVDDSDSDTDAGLPTAEFISVSVVVRKVPKMALVNGHFRGTAPPCLTTLTRVELSMVVRVNCIYSLTMLKKGCHWGSTATVFSVLNDVNAIAQILPRIPGEDDWAIIRSALDASSPREFTYTPFKVIQALLWLEENNPLWEGAFQRPAGSEWNGDGSHSRQDAAVIAAEPEDYEWLNRDMNGEDGNPVNPGAPVTNTSDILLVPTDNHQDLESQVSAIILQQTTKAGHSGVFTGAHRRTMGVPLRDYETDHFLQLAFVDLFPYGKGGPEPGGKFKVSAPYLSHLLNLGVQREFQQSPNYIFYAYSWKMKNRAGTLSYLATKNGDNDDNPVRISVSDAREFIEYIESQPQRRAQGGRNGAPVEIDSLITQTKMRLLLNKLLPYAYLLAGTELYMQSERKKLLSMISSPVTNWNAMWAYFFTEAQTDIYLSDIYDNAVTSARGTTHNSVPHSATVQERQTAADKLSKQERAVLLKHHPLLSARLHAAQQTIFWKYIIHGKSEPFGVVKDYWRRVEFQERGTPHSHNLINIAISKDGLNEDSLSVSEEAEVNARRAQLVKDAIRGVATSRLQARHANDFSELPVDDMDILDHLRVAENQYRWNPDRTTFFKDATHPCRERFVAEDRCYYFNTTTGEIPDLQVQSLYRRLQIANQLHVCRESCYKYCKPGQTRVCRYDFVKPILEGNFNSAVIVVCRDRRGRNRIRVDPPRNNGNLNVCAASPLIVLACKGNHDIQYIANKSGGAEYVSKYAAKTDTPDNRSLLNSLSRRLALKIISLPVGQNLTTRMTLRALTNALITATQIGSVHACYVISHSSSLVQSSRSTVYINALQRKEFDSLPAQFNADLLNGMADDENALIDSVRTQFGKRDAYHEFYKHHCVKFGDCDVDFHSFCTFYSLHENITASTLSTGLVTKITTESEHGFITSEPQSFVLKNVQYWAVKTPVVITLTPHIPHSENSERACYATLLLHSKWTNGEAGLLQGYPNAQVALDELLQPEFAPDSETYTVFKHYKSIKTRKQESETLLNDSGDPDFRPAPVTIDDFTAMMSELQEETSDTPLMFNQTTRGQPEDRAAPSNFEHRYVRDCSTSFYAYLNNFIPNLRTSTRDGHAGYNQCTEVELAQKIKYPNRIIELHDIELAREQLERDVSIQNLEQSRGYQAATKLLSGEDGRQLIMLVSGQGGVGKSKLINDITRYTQIRYGKTEGFFGAVMKTAPTGGAAYNIRGQTWHKALGRAGFIRLSKTKPLAPKSILKLQQRLKGVRLFILDEISLLALEDLWEISHRLGLATGRTNLPFGGLHVILAGDFYQMQCVRGTPIVQTDISHTNAEAREARAMFVSKMTHFVHLIHNVRAQQANNQLSPLAYIASKIRVADVEGNDVVPLLNARVLKGGEQEALSTAHPQAVWITGTHRRINQLNEMFLTNFVKNGSPITRLVATHRATKGTVKLPDYVTRKKLYNFGNPAFSNSSDEFAPIYIDLCVGSRVRIVTNLLTECGLFNGAMGTVWGFVYQGHGPQTNEERVPTNFSILEDYQRELPIVLVRMDGTDESFPYTCYDNVSRLVPISAIANDARMSADGRTYARWQIPILPAHARTGHSIQGFTSYYGVVNDVGSTFFAGEYVAISRATEIERVYLLKPLSESNFLGHNLYRLSVHQEYKRLMSSFDPITCEALTRRQRSVKPNKKVSL